MNNEEFKNLLSQSNFQEVSIEEKLKYCAFVEQTNF